MGFLVTAIEFRVGKSVTHTLTITATIKPRLN